MQPAALLSSGGTVAKEITISLRLYASVVSHLCDASAAATAGDGLAGAEASEADGKPCAKREPAEIAKACVLRLAQSLQPALIAVTQAATAVVGLD